MNFIVLGAGAIGCYVGGRLAAHGQPVCLVGRPHALEPIAQHGLKVTDLTLRRLDKLYDVAE